MQPLHIEKPSTLTVLSFDFVFIIIATSVFISFISIYNEKKAVEDLAKQLQVQFFVNIREKLGDYLAMPHRLNRLNAEIIAQNPAIFEDLEGLRPVYIRQLKAFETAGTVAVGIQKQGNYVGVAHREGGFFSSGLMNRDNDSTYRVSLLDSQGKAIRMLAETPDYDARTRSWYKTAVEAGKAAWSPVYIWASATDIGITAALPVYDTEGSLIAVQQSALTLGFISSFIQDLRMEKSVQVFITEPDGMLVASSDSEKVIRKGANGFERIQAVESNTPFTRAASAHLMNQFGKMSSIPGYYHANTEIDGQRYFIAASPLNDPHGLNWILITGLSESDILAQINANTHTTVFLCIIASLSAVWAALIIARRMASLNQCLELEVAEHRHAEEALKETEEQFRSMFENHHAVMLLIDPESGKIIRSNMSAQKYYGYAANEFEHLTIQQINQLSKEDIAAKMENARLEKRNCFHFPHKLATGTIRDVEVHSSPIPFEGKNILFSIIHDITERKQAEEALRIKDRAIETSINAIAISDLEGKITYVNPAFLNMWGYDDIKDILGKTVLEFWRIPEKADEVVGKLQDTGSWTGEMTAKKINGDLFEVHLFAGMVTDAGGKPLCMLASFIDITDRKRAEDAMRISLEKYRMLFESFPIGISVTDTNGNLLEVNRESERLLGVSVTEHTGRKIDGREWKIIRPDGTPMPGEEYASVRALKTRQMIENVEMGIIRENQETTWINVHAAPIPLEGYGVIITYHDITGRKRAEQAIEREKQRFSMLLEAFPGYIYLQAPDYSIVYANKYFRQQFGDIKGRRCYELMWNRTTPCEECPTFDVFNTKTPKLWENSQPVDGRIYSVYDFPFIDSDGSDLVLEIGVDITERKRAEEALLESEKKYRILAENAQDVIWTLDNNYKFTYISPSIYKLRGYTPEEAMEESYLETLTPESLNVVKQIQQRRLETDAQGRFDTISDFEIQQYCKDGSTVWVRIITHPIYDDHKNTIGYLGISRNIDKRKQIESELVTAKIVAESATRAKSEFLASMSHEIRTPMNVIVNMSKLLLETDLNSEQSNYARMVCESSDILLSLINDILDFSKIEAGKLDLESVDFNLESVVREVIRILRLKADEKRLHLRCFIHDDVFKHLQGDPSRLRQILINLVNNAIKFTHKGEVKITVIAEKQSETNMVIRFEVSDTGIGIPKDRVDRLFKPFSQADSSTTRKYGGTGLGLSISKKLVEMMGGENGAESQEGVGSTFWFTACFIKRLVKTDEMSEVIYQKQTRTSERLPLPAIRILLVEDNLFNQQVALAVLKKYGLSTDIANNGKEAVEILETTRYDLVLMDIEMPEMNGMEAVKIIRNSDSENRNVPIIAMTAHALKGSRERFIEAGMNDYLTKPIDPDILYTAIRCRFESSESLEKKQNSESCLCDDHENREVFDRLGFLKLMGGDETMVKMLLELFSEQVLQEIERLKTAVRENNTEEIRQHSHTLKGMAANISAGRLRDAAFEVETAGKQGDTEAAKQFTEKVEQEAQRLIIFLNR